MDPTPPKIRIAAIVPAYNEEKAIAAVVHALNRVGVDAGLELDVVVVNDCSTDHTSACIRELPCIPLDLPINLGIGGAVQTGFRYAVQQGYDYAVQVDGDGQHPAEEIPALVEAALQQGADVVVGSRYLKREGFQSSALRRFGIRYFAWLNRLLVGVVVEDSTSGFRLLSRRVLALVSEDYPDEYPEPEAIIIYAIRGFKIVEVPVVMKERQGGTSSIGGLSAIYYMFKVTLAILYTYLRLKTTK